MSELTVAVRPVARAQTGGGADQVLAYARAQIGKPYEWGATGPDSFDCSGLVNAAFKQIGVSLPRTTGGLITAGASVAKADLRPGDLVFPNPGHVQIYSGDGNVVEAPRKGKPVREVPMWGFLTARRVLDGSEGGSLIGGALDAVKDGLGAVPGVSEVADLASVLNPAKWAGEVQNVGLRLVIAAAGLGLVVLGAARLVSTSATAATEKVIDRTTEVLT